MTENTTATQTATESTELTDEQKKQIFDALPDTFKTAVTNLNNDIDKHNNGVAQVKSAEARDPKLIKSEIFEKNPSNNGKLAKIRKEYEKYSEILEKLVSQAYDVIESDGLMPAELTEEQIAAKKTELAASRKSLRDQVSALEQIETMMPDIKVLPLIGDIKTLQGSGGKSTGTKTGEGPKRLRFKRIEINNAIEDDKGNKVYGEANGEQKFTFTFASMFLRKQHKGISVAANDLTELYLAGQDENALPDVREFTYEYTFKDGNGHEVTVPYVIKCTR